MSTQCGSYSTPTARRPGVEGFDEGGADPAHRVQHQLAGLGVVGDGVRGDRGQHLGRVRGGLGHVAAVALGGGGGLRGRPHRGRQHPRRQSGLICRVDDRVRDRHAGPGEGVGVGGVVGVCVSHGGCLP